MLFRFIMDAADFIPEIDLLREEVRELTATVAGLRTELERR